MRIVQLQMFVLIEIGNQTLCNSWTALKDCNIKYQYITDLTLLRKTIIHEILI